MHHSLAPTTHHTGRCVDDKSTVATRSIWGRIPRCILSQVPSVGPRNLSSLDFVPATLWSAEATSSDGSRHHDGQFDSCISIVCFACRKCRKQRGPALLLDLHPGIGGDGTDVQERIQSTRRGYVSQTELAARRFCRRSIQKGKTAINCRSAYLGLHALRVGSSSSAQENVSLRREKRKRPWSNYQVIKAIVRGQPLLPPHHKEGQSGLALDETSACGTSTGS